MVVRIGRLENVVTNLSARDKDAYLVQIDEKKLCHSMKPVQMERTMNYSSKKAHSKHRLHSDADMP